VWGDSPANRATLAWIYQKQGQSEKGSQQFNLYRASINTMKRAYPQYLTASGNRLPKDVLRVIFPLQYWDLIRKYSAGHELDPYFVAALMAQESTFVPEIQSPAKAVGLMQLAAPTAGNARRVQDAVYPGLRTNPEANVKSEPRIWPTISRVRRPVSVLPATTPASGRSAAGWPSGPGCRARFIDDIPYPETQNYVKRILGTAEDYRRLYRPNRPNVEAVGIEKATQFTESVIREMTRLNEIRRREPVAGISRLSGAPGRQGRGLRPIQDDVNQYAVTWARPLRRPPPAVHAPLWRAGRARRTGDRLLRLDRGDDGDDDGHHRSGRRSRDLRAVLRNYGPDAILPAPPRAT
jgi:soluble lytic murein transglycosylase